MVTVCVCGHSLEAHAHYRRGSECAVCGPEVCRRYRPPRWWRRRPDGREPAGSAGAAGAAGSAGAAGAAGAAGEPGSAGAPDGTNPPPTTPPADRS
jgi:hypothetical protein